MELLKIKELRDFPKHFLLYVIIAGILSSSTWLILELFMNTVKGKIIGAIMLIILTFSICLAYYKLKKHKIISHY